MGWVKQAGKPVIWDYDKPKTLADCKKATTQKYHDKESGSGLEYWTWQMGTLWNKYEVCIKYINDSTVPLKISKVGIQTVSCHSGGKSYWSSTGLITTPCVGTGGTYTSYVRVSNDGEKTYEVSSFIDSSSNVVPDITSSNMNSAGTSSKQTASFGNPPYTGNKALIAREYTISDCPTIQPGGCAYIHLRVDINNNPSTTVIRFILDTDELDVVFEPDESAYIWRYESDNKWHLRKPLFVAGKNNTWNKPMED